MRLSTIYITLKKGDQISNVTDTCTCACIYNDNSNNNVYKSLLLYKLRISSQAT